LLNFQLILLRLIFFFLFLKKIKIIIMKKQLLLGAMLCGAFMTANAQDTCDSPLDLGAGITAVGAINGDYEVTAGAGACWNTAAQAPATPSAEWYIITADENSMIRINTNLASNVAPNSVDTRISVYTGECGNLVCYAGNDDVNDTNFRSDFTFPAASGEFYYVAFDNAWSSAGFNVEVTITPTTCFSINTATLVLTEDPTETTVGIGWDAPIGEPGAYRIEYGLIGFTPGSADGTVVTVNENQIMIDDLEPSTEYEFYITSVCGLGDETEAIGPIRFSTVFLPADLPYYYSFESPLLGGWGAITAQNAGGPWEAMSDADEDWEAQDGDTAMAAGAFGVAMDTWLFSRGINLTANEEVTVGYYLRKRVGAGAGATNNVVVTVGQDVTAADQTEVLETYNAFGTSDAWEFQTTTFTPDATGVYFFGFHCTSPAMAQANFGWITVDSFYVDATAGTNNPIASQLSIFPNPATNVINVANADNILVNGVQITDLNGRIVKSVKFNGVTEAQVNVSDLANGMYMMTVTSDKGTMTQKIVKN
jgi:Secretion system C-terminal sorting domain/Fibronectin type III domain